MTFVELLKYAVVQFTDNIFKEECIFKAKYGIYCPGCGGIRATIALLHFNFIDSILSNPIVIIIVADAILFLILKLYETFENKKGYYRIRSNILIITLVIWLLFAVIRDILLITIGYDYLGDFL